jgi:hypothetical protein
VPDKYEHLVRYNGDYSNRARGARRLAELQTEEHALVTLNDRPPDRRCKPNWARLIQKVYEVDPLECPNCGATMRIIALIDACDGITQIFDACAANTPRNPTLADRESRFSITAAPAVADHR